MILGGEFHARDARILLLLEFFETVELFELHVEYMVILQDVITLFSNLNHSTNDLIFDEKRMEAEG